MSYGTKQNEKRTMFTAMADIAWKPTTHGFRAEVFHNYDQAYLTANIFGHWEIICHDKILRSGDAAGIDAVKQAALREYRILSKQ